MLEQDQDGMAFANLGQRNVPRLLVVDDDTLHRMIICRVAAKAGYAPAGAATYDEAARLVHETVFDCITLDLALGAHAGTEMLHHLSIIDYRGPIIIVSGCDDAARMESVRLAKSLGLNVFESTRKPVDLTVLRFWLERLKAGRGAAAAAVAA
jgi:two-component system, chemotaxis family, chemotaxis protein CheY